MTTDDESSDLTLEEAVGEMLIVGFDGEGPQPPAPVRDRLESGHLGGVILFDRNIRSLEQLVDLNESIHAAAARANRRPFVSVDQEGGRVMRVREGVTEIPPMAEIGSGGDPRRIAEVSEVIGRELASLGFNLNFAPVLDVDSNPDNPVIGDRAFSDDPQTVATAAGAYLHGHSVAGVVPCGKHFPGHGDTETDSHRDLPVLAHGLDRLRRVELVPFESAAGAGIPMIMTAHVLLPALDAARPATLSPAVLDLLRDELGFDGPIVSDDLEMDAISERWSLEEVAELGLDAGLDIFLVCRETSTWRRLRELLLEAAESSEHRAEQIRASARRVRRLKREFFGHQPMPWERSTDWRDRLGTDEHRRMIEG